MTEHSEKYQMIDAQISNLYFVCLEFYATLRSKNHPMINLISEVLDELIRIKKIENKDDEQYRLLFIDVNSKAYKNINDVYDYDKKIKDEEDKQNKKIDKSH